MRSAPQQAGVDATKYSGHSFCIGAASTAAAVGVQDSTIKTLGRWQSSAYQLYVQIPRGEASSNPKEAGRRKGAKTATVRYGSLGGDIMWSVLWAISSGEITRGEMRR